MPLRGIGALRRCLQDKNGRLGFSKAIALGVCCHNETMPQGWRDASHRETVMTRPIVMIFATIFTLGMLWGGLVSGGMLVFSSLKGESHSIFLAHLVIFIVSGILLVAVLFIYNRIDKERRKSIIARVKAESGIDFSTGREIGLPSDNWAVFDEPSRKVLISALGGRRVMVHPYEHIKSWKLTWIESSRNGRLRETDAKIEFDLNDLDHSRFVVPMLSKGDGEAWCSRLDTLLSAR